MVRAFNRIIYLTRYPWPYLFYSINHPFCLHHHFYILFFFFLFKSSSLSSVFSKNNTKKNRFYLLHANIIALTSVKKNTEWSHNELSTTFIVVLSSLYRWLICVSSSLIFVVSIHFACLCFLGFLFSTVLLSFSFSFFFVKKILSKCWWKR